MTRSATVVANKRETRVISSSTGRHAGEMRHNIVEGEPGIFPDPIARFLRWVFGPIARSRHEEAHDQPTPERDDDADQPSS